MAAVLTVGGSRPARAGGFDPDPVFPVGHISATVGHQIPRLEHVASVLAGRHTVVNCWSNRGWAQLQAWEGSNHDTMAVDAAGLTYVRAHRIQLSPFECQILAQVLDRSAQQPLFTAWGVTVLAHESAHASGIAAENRAECRAIETEPHAARLLGISRPLARRFQHIYRGTVYPYDLSRYRIPVCAAGRPGVLVPDTLGTEAKLQPLEHAATGVTRSLQSWRNVGGAGSVGPLSPCSPIKSRTEELARFGVTLLGPRHEILRFSVATLKTKRDFSVALSRYKPFPRCDLGLIRTRLHEIHSTDTVSLRLAPTAVTDLSSQVQAFRIRYVRKTISWDEDAISIADPAGRTIASLRFEAASGEVPVSVEVRAVSALLQGEATMARRSGR